MSNRVLLIDDDVPFTEMVETIFTDGGYQVKVARDGIDGLRQLLEWGPDLIILDVMMPRMDGWETCRRIREICEVPIFFLTGLDGMSQEMRGLGEGADLYMTKPLDVSLLLKRVTALMKRVLDTGAPSVQKPVTVGDLEVFLTEYRVTKGGQPLDLSPTEFRLLAALAANPGRVVPSQKLIGEVWGENLDEDQEQYLKLYVHYLRRKIEADPANPRFIRNKRGVGYFLADQEADVPARRP